jgi:hypothetical protein
MLNREDPMKRLIPIILLILFAAGAFGQTTLWFDGSFEQAQQKAEKDGKLILTFFYSPT